MAPWATSNHRIPEKPPVGVSLEGFDETGGFRTKQTLRLGYARIQESHCVRQDQ
jgi:hypothetical protein